MKCLDYSSQYDRFHVYYLAVNVPNLEATTFIFVKHIALFGIFSFIIISDIWSI